MPPAEGNIVRDDSRCHPDWVWQLRDENLWLSYDRALFEEGVNRLGLLFFLDAPQLVNKLVSVALSTSLPQARNAMHLLFQANRLQRCEETLW